MRQELMVVTVTLVVLLLCGCGDRPQPIVPAVPAEIAAKQAVVQTANQDDDEDEIRPAAQASVQPAVKAAEKPRMRTLCGGVTRKTKGELEMEWSRRATPKGSRFADAAEYERLKQTEWQRYQNALDD